METFAPIFPRQRLQKLQIIFPRDEQIQITSPVCVRLGRRGSNEGSAAEIFAEYKISDNWQIAPGYMSFNSPKDSRLGQYSENDMVYFRLRYRF